MTTNDARHKAQNDKSSVCESKAAFEAHIRVERRPFIGSEADAMTEADYVSDLAEDGWPDYDKWLTIWCRISEGGELTPDERKKALIYYSTEDGTDVPSEYRI